MSNNVIQGYPTPPKDYYKVYVCSTTYNQSSYIEDCLNGVAMQKTDFPFVHHVIDDFVLMSNWILSKHGRKNV